MHLMSEFTQGSKTAKVYYSSVKQEYLVQLNDDTVMHKFLTEQDAEDYAEDWVLKPIECGSVKLKRVPLRVKVDIKGI